MLRVLWPLFVVPVVRQPAAVVFSVAAIALGVALGFAVALIHRAALDALSHGQAVLGETAVLQVVAGRGGVPESLYGVLATLPGVGRVTPVIVADLRLADRPERLRLIGIDTVRAAVQAVGPLDSASPPAAPDGGLLAEDAIAVSAAAARQLQLVPGASLRVVVGSDVVTLRVVAVLREPINEPLAVADIAVAQTRFGTPGFVSRFDLGGIRPEDRAVVRAAVADRLPPGGVVDTPDLDARHADRLSRAYRANLSMLALVALVTGSFLVFAVQSARIVRRRAELALLRALGLSSRELFGGMLAEAAVVGGLGSLLGVGLGYALAYALLQTVGGDLGAGYFRGHVTWTAAPELAVVYGALGVFAAILGAWLPAREAAAMAPASGLRAGDDQRLARAIDRVGPGAACLALGAAALLLPAVNALPLGGYLAIGLWLAGGLLLLPRLARLLWAGLPLPRRPGLALALAQLRGTGGLTAIGVGGVYAATAVAAAMMIMVGSFRSSVDQWLSAVLPADLYVRSGRAADASYFDAVAQAQISAVAGVHRADFVHADTVLLDPRRPPVAVIARPLHGRPPPALIGSARAVPAPARALWASEAMADLYGWRPGDTVRLPLAGQWAPFVVAGLWRDYVRTEGAVVIERADYIALTGVARTSEAALYLAPGADVARVVADLRRGPLATPGMEVASQLDLRARTLHIFDRTFAVTWALQAAAVLIGLVGVGASFAALSVGRLREFGMLMHLGCDRRFLSRMIGAEAAACAALGVVIGLTVGGAIALVLIEVVNRQSFHWSMDIDVPWRVLATLAAAMVGAAVVAARLAARPALGARAIRAVREDW